MKRYTAYCQGLGLNPVWYNVYNKVTVKIQNTEFNQLTKRELELAQYLDKFENLVRYDLGDIDVNTQEVFRLYYIGNNQDKKTSLFIED